MSQFTRTQLGLEVLDARDVPAVVMPSGDAVLTSAPQDDTSAIVFVGGWGSSSYQYAFEGTYNNSAAGEKSEPKTKHVTAICYGVSVLAYARVDGTSTSADDVIVDGKIITAENYDSAR